ncbi:hypothetical protein ICY20_18055 [Pseudomonas sp. P115]|uniref:hypothetical protein n=1 Tax=Pseudomonas pisciculturae TaxID=2730413 RepID=UPI0018928645|nr:hypothetical protein [Pseudomonas pisciculturae]MBF6029656.1 hypothetical protein [Pseudomonas pisciculturae]
MSKYVVTQAPDGHEPHWIVKPSNFGPTAPGFEFMLDSESDSKLLAQMLNSRPAYQWVAEVNDMDHEELYQATLKIEDLKLEWSKMGIKIVTYAPVGHGLL